MKRILVAIAFAAVWPPLEAQEPMPGWGGLRFAADLPGRFCLFPSDAFPVLAGGETGWPASADAFFLGPAALSSIGAVA